MRGGCLVCRSQTVERVLDLGHQPVASHFAQTAAEAKSCVTHPLRLCVCTDCGAVQLERPFPYTDLVPPHDWLTYREPEAHLDAVAAKLLSLPGLKRGGVARGLSFKDASLLARLGEAGMAGGLLDPREDLGTDNPNANIESVAALLTPGRARAYAARRGQADVVVARHVLEHAAAPWRFMAALGEMVRPGGYMVIEAPDCRANLERPDYAMVWEEHTLYFTPETLSHALAMAGCVTLDMEIHPFAFEDVIVLYARKEAAGTRAPAARPQAAVERDVAVARGFGAAFPAAGESLRATLSGLMADGKPLAAYGAGHLSCAFINFHGLADLFACVVDDTREKQGLFMPGSGLEIVPRSALVERGLSVCLMGLSPDIEEKVIANNAPFLDQGGVFYSMLADSSRSVGNL